MYADTLMRKYRNILYFQTRVFKSLFKCDYVFVLISIPFFITSDRKTCKINRFQNIRNLTIDCGVILRYFDFASPYFDFASP